jgi:hypothetical protein
MGLPRFQFTIRRLILMIAGCAIVLALLRTPFGFLVIAFGFVLPGFIVGRARGGDGVIGGALSASLISGGLVVAGSALSLPAGQDLGRALVNFVSLLFAVVVMAFVLGVLLSAILYAILKLLRTMIESPLPDESNGSIRWHWQDDGPVERE